MSYLNSHFCGQSLYILELKIYGVRVINLHFAWCKFGSDKGKKRENQDKIGRIFFIRKR